MAAQASRHQGGRVLVVDDDPEIIQILTVNLAHAGLDVISAQDGAEALAKAFTEKPDLILLDIVLPDLDGLEVCRRLKEAPKTSHIPVIIISARVDSEYRTEAVAAGAEQYITKPFAPIEVVALVIARLRQLKQRRAPNRLTGLAKRS